MEIFYVLFCTSLRSQYIPLELFDDPTREPLSRAIVRTSKEIGEDLTLEKVSYIAKVTNEKSSFFS